MKCSALTMFVLASLVLALGCHRSEGLQSGNEPSGSVGSATSTDTDPGESNPAPPVVDDPVTLIEKRSGVVMLDETGKPKTVTLAETRITDGELALLTELPTLEGLNLFRTQTTDAGLAHLAALTNLKWLSLAETSIGDDGLAHLSSLDGLESLDLDGTAVTDKGLEHLAGLKNLTRLNLEGTKVSEIGVEKLQEELPSLKVER